MNEETLNMSIRKFLKSVGVQSQREIEQAVSGAVTAGRLKGHEKLAAKVTLTIESLGVTRTIDGTIELE
ncbi:MAG TPA: DUF6494 family protein [Usitatibacteraceae bacterium]